MRDREKEIKERERDSKRERYKRRLVLLLHQPKLNLEKEER